MKITWFLRYFDQKILRNIQFRTTKVTEMKTLMACMIGSENNGIWF